MTFNEWLDKKSGRVGDLAKHFGITPAAVTHWRTNGVPKKKMLEVRELTGKRVSFQGMLPRSDKA